MNYLRTFLISSVVIVLFATMFVSASSPVYAATLAEQLSGKILLQVQSHGEAWYVDPITKQRYYLGRPADAFALMRTKGIGIRHQELQKYLTSVFPVRLSGRIMLDVESHGEAYYVFPGSRKGIFLGRPADAFNVMRTYGLGASNNDLARIPTAPSSPLPSPAEPTPSLPTENLPVESPSALEERAFTLVNSYRQSQGLSPLTWNATVASVAREHSQNMADGTVAFSHDGFSARVNTLKQNISFSGSAENLAYNQGYNDPAQTAVNGWLNSSGHLANIRDSSYAAGGMGVAESADGSIYFTQLFLATP